jgi:hypothetical protein
LVFALHVPLIWGRPRRAYVFAMPIVTALLLASVRQMRTEPVLIAGSVLLTYVFVAQPRLQRAVMCSSFVIVFGLASSLWSRWFDAKWEEAQRVVAEAGGHPFPGAREKHHLVWHPIWCGLGDFGEDKGYRWDDRVAAQYALPLLASKYGVEVPKWDPSSYVIADTFVDPGKRYYQVPFLLPHYTDVVRDKVLADIKGDPLWYFGVLLRRAWRVLAETTPLSIAVGAYAVRIPFHGLFALAIAVFALAKRRRALALSFVFLLPLSTTAIAIYSGGGVPNYGCYHLVPAALLVTCVLVLGRLHDAVEVSYSLRRR